MIQKNYKQITLLYIITLFTENTFFPKQKNTSQF